MLRFGGCEPGKEGEANFTSRLHMLTCPALVMCGDEDVLTALHFSRILAEHLPKARLQVQQNCGHVNLLEQPGQSAAAILDFLSSQEKP